jgi:hypothetical protein
MSSEDVVEVVAGSTLSVQIRESALEAGWLVRCQAWLT